MPGVTYTKNIALTNVWSATYSGSGSGTIYTVPSDCYVDLTTIEVFSLTTYNVYVSGAKILTSASSNNGNLNGNSAVSGEVISFDSTGGGGGTSVTIHFKQYKNAI